MMGPIYENVWAQSTLLDVGSETIASSIGFDWFPDYDLSRRHYYGPGDVWWGADMAVAPLVENLGRDPAADKILFNLIEWTSGARD